MHQGDFNAVASLFTLINFEQAFVVVRGLVRGANWGVDSVADFEAAFRRTTFDYFGRFADSVVDQLDGGPVLLESAAAGDLQTTFVGVRLAVRSTDGRPVRGTEDRTAGERAKSRKGGGENRLVLGCRNGMAWPHYHE